MSISEQLEPDRLLPPYTGSKRWCGCSDPSAREARHSRLRGHGVEQIVAN
jgi:hypothetical protein